MGRSGQGGACLASSSLPSNMDSLERRDTRAGSLSSFEMAAWQSHAACEFLVLGINGCNEDRAFTVRHFAGDVSYQVDHFLQKNTETMETQTRQLLQADGLSFLRPILA